MVRPRIAILARFAENTSATRYAAVITARRLAEGVWAAGGEPLGGEAERAAAVDVVHDPAARVEQGGEVFDTVVLVDLDLVVFDDALVHEVVEVLVGVPVDRAQDSDLTDWRVLGNG